MRFTHEMRYDAAPADVYAMLGEPTFREKVCASGGALRQDVDITPAGAGMHVRIDQTQPAKGIPSFAAKFVGDEIRIIQDERWRGPEGGDFTLEIPGKPGRCAGSIRLSDDGSGGTLETVTGDLEVNIPLVGGKLESMIADLMRSAMRNEERVGHSWLSSP